MRGTRVAVRVLDVIRETCFDVSWCLHAHAVEQYYHVTVG